MDTHRRKFLTYAGFGTVAAAAGLKLVFGQGEKSSISSSAFFSPDVEINLKAAVREIQVLPGNPTRVYKLTAQLLKGPEGTVKEIPGSYLGPVLRFRKGQKVRIRFDNEIPEQCIIHWHGLHVPEKSDGHPKYGISTGQSYVYEFEVKNRAGTYFYHSHTHHATAEQAYKGLAGLLLVSDAEEEAFNLPTGNYDIPLVIQDPRFDGQNQLLYVGHMPERMRGLLGDRILVNGLSGFELSVASRAYRLRLVNASNSRIYKLAWSDQTPLRVIGTDGGLLEHPVTRPYVVLAPGERVDLWADFSGRRAGTELVMRSLSFSGVMPMHGMMGGMGRGRMGGGMGHGMMGGMGRGMMGRGMGGPMGMGMMGGGALPHGSEFPVVKVRVTQEVKENRTLSTFPQRSLSVTINDQAHRRL